MEEQPQQQPTEPPEKLKKSKKFIVLLILSVVLWVGIGLAALNDVNYRGVELWLIAGGFYGFILFYFIFSIITLRATKKGVIKKIIIWGAIIFSGYIVVYATFAMIMNKLFY